VCGQIAVYCEHGTEPPGSIKGGKYFDQQNSTNRIFLNGVIRAEEDAIVNSTSEIEPML
jgi:hypothetical protein